MMIMRPRTQLLVVVCFIVAIIGSTFVLTQMMQPRVGTIPGSNKQWAMSTSFSNTDHSFSVVLMGVTFTFIGACDAPPDAPILLNFTVHFADGTLENLTTEIGGWIYTEPRVVFSNHTGPRAAIVSAYGPDPEEFYGWYYAVSLESGSSES